MSSFLDQSLLLQQWDEQLLANADCIAAIQQQAADIQSKQAAINRAIDVCDSEQKELNAHLTQLEATLDTLPPHTTTNPATTTAAAAADDDTSRRETYQLAEEVDAHLSTLSSTLGQTIATLNERVGGVRGRGGAGDGAVVVAGSGGGGGGGVGLMGQLTDILNVHLQSLQWLEAEAEAMEQALQRTTQQAAAVQGVQHRNGGINGRGVHGVESRGVLGGGRQSGGRFY